jgi:hypothetical protein
MFNLPRFPGNTSSLGWFARLAGPLLGTNKPDLLYHSVSAFDRFFISCFFHKSPRSNGEIIVTTRRAPYDWKAQIQRGAAWCPEGIINGSAITNPVPCISQHDASHLGLGEPLALLASYRRYPPPRRGARGCILEGKWNTEQTNVAILAI